MQTIRASAILLLFCAFTAAIYAQMPLPQAEGILVGSTLPEPTFRDFLRDKPQMTAASIAFGAKSFDLGQTLWHKANYDVFHEDWMPTQNPVLIGAAMMGSQVATTYLQFRLYRSGHRKLAMMTQFISAGVSIGGSAYSFTNVTPAHQQMLRRRR